MSDTGAESNSSEKSEASGSSSEEAVLSVELRNLVLLLVDFSTEKDTEIIRHISHTIKKIGLAHPNEVLQTLLESYSAHSSQSKSDGKVVHQTKIKILECIRDIIETHVEKSVNQVSETDSLAPIFPIAKPLIQLCLGELGRLKDSEPEIEVPCGEILVAIGAFNCIDLMAAYLDILQPGGQPTAGMLDVIAGVAIRNVFGVIPFLKTLLGMLVPLMQHSKSTAVRVSFSNALYRLSEALAYYINNMDRAPDKNVRSEYYAVELAMVFELLFTSWMETKHTQLCQSTLEAVGSIALLMPPVRLVEYGPKLLHNILALYKSSHIPPLNVTRCLSQSLAGLSAHPTFGIEVGGPVWESMLSTLFNQVSSGHDFEYPETVQNHYELLRCYEILARVCTERVIRNVILKLDSSHTKARVGVFTVLRHLANVLKSDFQPFTEDVNRVLKHSLPDNRNPVRHAIIQLITTLALQGQLKSDVIEDFVSYLLKLCFLDGGSATLRTSIGNISAFLDGSDGKVRPANITNEDIRQTSENALLVMASSCASLENYLWTEFMSLVLRPDAVGIAPLVIRILAIVAARRKLVAAVEEHEELGEKSSCPVAVVTRCLVMAGVIPHHNATHVASALEFLKDFGKHLNGDLETEWDVRIPPLIMSFRDSLTDLRIADPNERRQWRIHILNLFETTIDFLDRRDPSGDTRELPTWADKFASAIESQVELYADFPEERAFSFLMLGAVAERIDSKDEVEKKVDFILQAARPIFEVERHGCGEALGIISRSHLDSVLSRLHIFEKGALVPKSSGFFATFRRESRSKLDTDMIRVMLLTAYGESAAKAPHIQLITHADPMAVVITHILEGTNNLEVRRAGLEAVGSVAQSLLSDGVSDQCVLESEVSLIGICLAEMAEESGKDDFLVTALHAITALISLPKILDQELRERILHSAFETTLPTYAYLESLQTEVKALKLSVALKDLVLHLAKMNLEPKSIEILLSEMLRWIDYDNPYIRNIILQILQMTLSVVLDECRIDLTAHSRIDFSAIVASLLTRCFDSSPSARNEAIGCLGVVIRLSSRLQGLPTNHDEAYIEKLAEIKLVLMQSDDRLLVEVAHALCKVTSTQVPVGSLSSFIEHLSKGIEDPSDQASRGVSVMIWSFLSDRGSELHLRTGETLKLLFAKLPKILNQETILYMLQGIVALGRHHMDAVVNELVQHPLPFDESIKKCFRIMACDPNLNAKVLRHLVVFLGQGQVLDDHLPLNGSIIAHRPLATVIAIGTMALEPEFYKALEGQFANTFGSLLLLCGCFLDTNVAAAPPQSPAATKQERTQFVPKKETYKLNPFTCVREAALNVATCMNMNLTAQTVKDFEPLDLSPRLNPFCNKIASVARVATVEASNYLEDLTELFIHALKVNIDRYRITAAPFLAELINQGCGGQEQKLLEPILQGLASAQTDTQPVVRKWALKGLSALSKCSCVQIDRHCSSVLNALVVGLEDDTVDATGRKQGGSWFKEREHDDITACAHESLVGLSKLLPLASKSEICRLAPRLAVRVRSFFEKDDARLRAAAFVLVGSIFQYGFSAGCEEQLTDAANASLVALLMHTSEVEADVSIACLTSLMQGAPIFGLEELLSFFEHLKARQPTSHEYKNLLESVIAIMVAKDEEKLVNMLAGASVYFKSPQAELRASSVLLAGHIFREVDPEAVANIRKQASVGLAHLLRDSNRSVRLQALDAAALIYS